MPDKDLDDFSLGLRWLVKGERKDKYTSKILKFKKLVLLKVEVFILGNG